MSNEKLLGLLEEMKLSYTQPKDFEDSTPNPNGASFYYNQAIRISNNRIDLLIDELRKEQ